jgi:hypothetical protein
MIMKFLNKKAAETYVHITEWPKLQTKKSLFSIKMIWVGLQSIYIYFK